MFVWLASVSNQDLAIFGEGAGVKGAEGVAQTCTALIVCPTVALQSVLLVVPGTVHCHVRNNTTPTEAFCAAETAWRGEVEVLLSFHCTEVTKLKNLNDLPS